MNPISIEKRKAFSLRIVKDFGNGELVPNTYLFEQILQLPAGASAHRMKISDAVSTITEASVVVLLDIHPHNRESAEEVSKHIGAHGAFEFQCSKNELAAVLCFDQCDMYVTTLDGRLLLVGCHEDSVIDGEREVWVPVTGG